MLDAVNCWKLFRGFEKSKRRARNIFTNTTTTPQCILNLSGIRTTRSPWLKPDHEGCTYLYLSKLLLLNLSAVWFGMPLPQKVRCLQIIQSNTGSLAFAIWGLEKNVARPWDWTWWFLYFLLQISAYFTSAQYQPRALVHLRPRSDHTPATPTPSFQKCLSFA